MIFVSISQKFFDPLDFEQVLAGKHAKKCIPRYTCSSYDTRNSKTFLIPEHKTEYCKKSFHSLTLNDWNNITHQSKLNIFEEQLRMDLKYKA